MISEKGNIRTCANGHRYYKNSDCPVCPVCEKNRAPTSGFLSKISAPARRALEREGILSLEKLSEFSKVELLDLHGLGPTTIPKLKKELAKENRTFKNTPQKIDYHFFSFMSGPTDLALQNIGSLEKFVAHIEG